MMSLQERLQKVARQSAAEITFSEKDSRGVHFPQNDALIIEAIIGNHTVHRILVDNGSSVDILYHGAFTKMRLACK